jgi:hypothetical protein
MGRDVGSVYVVCVCILMWVWKYGGGRQVYRQVKKEGKKKPRAARAPIKGVSSSVGGAPGAMGDSGG